MNTFWIVFEDGTAGCCQGINQQHAKSIALKLKEKIVAEVFTLPYPATPVIWQFDDPVHGETPTFCTTPNQCKGRTACPKSYSCTE